MNIYDLEHVCTTHPKMSADEWRSVYDRAWDVYYSLDHLATLMRRAAAVGRNPKRIFEIALQFYGCYRYERVHPLQGGFFRRKIRTERRPMLPRQNPFVFYPRRVAEFLRTFCAFGMYAWRVHRVYRQVRREIALATEPYADEAMPAAAHPLPALHTVLSQADTAFSGLR